MIVMLSIPDLRVGNLQRGRTYSLHSRFLPFFHFPVQRYVERSGREREKAKRSRQQDLKRNFNLVQNFALADQPPSPLRRKEGMFQPQPTSFSPFSPYGNLPPPSSVPFHFAASANADVVDSAGPVTFRTPVFALNTNPLPHLPFQQNIPQQEFKMAEQSDLEAQQALARDFQPVLEGPLVGDKKSSHAITEEYAKADPVYVAKTAVSLLRTSFIASTKPGKSLPRKYSHYRPILGDGNCGWRAAGFSYFETLLRQADKSRLEEEIARMISLNNLLQTAGGHQFWLFEDMVGETTTLLKGLANMLPESPQAAMRLLMETFNDAEASNNIVYHLRLLASSWLKDNPEGYQDFIPDGIGVDGYKKDWLELPNQEIDHLGMTLLIDVLLKPIGIAVEVVYLDRSEGTQVNSHVMQNEDSNGVPTNPGCPMIHLLYRPSHYDILYKDIEAPMVVRQSIEQMGHTPIQVNRAAFNHHTVQRTSSMNDFANIDLTTLLNIPGFIQPSHHGFPASYHTQLDQTFTPSPVSNSISPISPVASTPSSTIPTNDTLPLTLNTSHFPASTSLAVHPLPHQPHTQQLSPQLSSPASQLSATPTSASSSFRPSKYNWEAAAEWQEQTPSFQTSTFRNSHYNTAHYNNPNFQPEEWCPDADEGWSGSSTSGLGGRKKSG
ncbi:Ubiquitinyl hydrolase 1 [Chlorociboria aeruginascens]|nr:Ubiquitinyl hydrolase 1 [Chlorociboria aeruginascens]